MTSFLIKKKLNRQHHVQMESNFYTTGNYQKLGKGPNPGPAQSLQRGQRAQLTLGFNSALLSPKAVTQWISLTLSHTICRA